MRVLDVIESRVWHHKPTGRKASIHGSVPWTRPADRDDWEMVTQGWTWRMDDGTVGMCRFPAATREEAVAVMEAVNARRDAQLEEHHRRYPHTRPKAAA